MIKNYFQHFLQNRTFGDVVSDKVASIVGSWYFIIIQSVGITFWIYANTIGIPGVAKWDPFPFIFLNLALSFQAAYTAPIIMMSQNRQAEIDRANAQADYEVNKLAEQEIEMIQTEIDEVKSRVQQNAAIKEELTLIRTQLDTLHKVLERKDK
jgi:uncharacterized membrane protein